MSRTRQIVIGIGILIILAVAGYFGYRYQIFADSTTPSMPKDVTGRAASDDVILNWNKGTGRKPYTYVVYKSTSQDGTYTRINNKRLKTSDYREVDGLKSTQTAWYRITAANRNNGKLAESAATAPIQVSLTAINASPSPTSSTTPTTSPSPSPSASPITINGPILYVGPNGTDTNNDCKDTNRRCRQISYAITKAVAGTGTTISIGDNATYNGVSIRNFGINLSDTDAQTKPLTLKAEGKNITISPNGRDTITIYGEKIKGLILDKIKIDNAGRNNVKIIDSSFLTIKNSAFYQGDSACILLVRTHDVLIDSVTAARSDEHHGIYISDNSNNITIKNSTIYGNGAAGIQINSEKLPGDSTQAIAKNILIEKNMIYNNGWAGGAALNLLGVQDSIIQDNVIFNNYAGGIAAVWADQGTSASLRPVGGPKNLQILNNTIVMASSNPRRNGVLARYAISFIDSAGQNALRGNVIYHPQGKALSFGNQTKSDTANLASNDNTYRNGSVVALYDSAKQFALSDWQQENFTWSGAYNQRNSQHDQDSDIIASLNDVIDTNKLPLEPVNGSVSAAALDQYLK